MSAEVAFILVEPARAENIGAAARALKTMGFSHLWLVNAAVEDPARWVAHESGDILEQARHFPDLATALREVDFSIATTARRRLQRDDYLAPPECRHAIDGKGAAIKQAALVFGRESSGLTGEEIALCDTATSIPLKVEQPSLNLAQAVMLYAWELARPQPKPEPPAGADGATYNAARALLDRQLDRLGVGMEENLRQWAGEGLARFDERDLGMLMTLLRRLDPD